MVYVCFRFKGKTEGNNWFLPSNVNLSIFVISVICFLAQTLSSTLHLLLNLVAIDSCAKCFIFSDSLSFYCRLERNIYSWFCENILNWKLNFVTVLLLSLYQMSHLF